MYRGTKILVLDEATSNLDIETEKKLIDSLMLIKGKKTIIYVTHRPNALKLCDKIYTIDDSKKLIQVKE